ncbi:MAG TPA: hypothetical protein VIU40_13965 [Geobacteraceae bacterium]
MSRPPDGATAREAFVTIRFTAAALAALDEARGSTSRSHFIRAATTREIAARKNAAVQEQPQVGGTVIIPQTTPPSQRPVPSPPVGEKPHRHRPGAVVNRRSDHGVMEVQYQCLTCPEVLPWRRA